MVLLSLVYINFVIRICTAFIFVFYSICTPFALARRLINNKNCLLVTIHSHFLFFLEYLSNTYEATLSCFLGVTWNYSADYQTAEIGSRTIITSKMKLFVTLVHSFHPLKIVTMSSILNVVWGPGSDSY